MAATDTTTIRVPIETRNQLNSLAARRNESAGDVVAKLVSAADEDAVLTEVVAGFEKIAADPEALSAYRAESEELESGFERRPRSGKPMPTGRRRLLGRSQTDSRQGPEPTSAVLCIW